MANEVPPKFIIIEKTSTTVPGDLRSKTNPGHGYPEHTVERTECRVFEDREKWLEECERLFWDRRRFEAGQFIPATIKPMLQID